MGLVPLGTRRETGTIRRLTSPKVTFSKTIFCVWFMALGEIKRQWRCTCMADLLVEWCKQYYMPGFPFTSNGRVSSSGKIHATAKMAHLNKCICFLKKNSDIPIVVKKRIFAAALMSAILYVCESWLNADLRPVTKLYTLCIKQLLCVRTTTCNDMCYVQLGHPPLKDLVLSWQTKFLKKMWQERIHMKDDPLIFAIKTTLNNTLSTRSFVSQLINVDRNDRYCHGKTKVWHICLRFLQESDTQRNQSQFHGSWHLHLQEWNQRRFKNFFY